MFKTPGVSDAHKASIRRLSSRGLNKTAWYIDVQKTISRGCRFLFCWFSSHRKKNPDDNCNDNSNNFNNNDEGGMMMGNSTTATTQTSETTTLLQKVAFQTSKGRGGGGARGTRETKVSDKKNKRSNDNNNNNKEETAGQTQPRQQGSNSSSSNEMEEEEELDPFLFIKHLPPYFEVAPDPTPVYLPPKKQSDPPITLVLDLDETLVHCSVDPLPNAQMVFPLEFQGITYTVFLKTRPHLRRFLDKVSKDFEICIFTASSQVYADQVLDRIDPNNKYFQHRLYRESCINVHGNYIKDLNVLGRDLKKVVTVDDNPVSFGYQVENGIPIVSWMDDVDDCELLKCEIFLRRLHRVHDCRTVVRKQFNTLKLVMSA